MVWIGNLDRRINLESRGVTRSASGEEVESWSLIATVWAQKRDVRGEERFTAGGRAAAIDTVFKIRHRTDVGEGDRVVYDGNNYDITAVVELGRKEALELYATADPAV